MKKKIGLLCMMLIALHFCIQGNAADTGEIMYKSGIYQNQKKNLKIYEDMTAASKVVDKVNYAYGYVRVKSVKAAADGTIWGKTGTRAYVQMNESLKLETEKLKAGTFYTRRTVKFYKKTKTTAKVSLKLKLNTSTKIKKFVCSSTGVYWGKVKAGRYVRTDQISKTKTSTIKGKNATLTKSSIYFGSSMTNSGSLSSKTKLKTVKVFVRDENKKTVASVSAKPRAYYYSLKSLNKKLAFKNLQPGNYTYYVQAKESLGLKTQTLTVQQFTVKLRKTTVTAYGSSDTSINVSWSGVAGAAKYQIYRSIGDANSYALVQEVNALQYYDTGLIRGNFYDYKVRAVSLTGKCGAFSTAVQAQSMAGWAWPLASYTSIAQYYHSSHHGVDILAAKGTLIYPVRNGTVVCSFTRTDYGEYVVVQMDNGDYSLYAHMTKRLVKEGDKVTVNTPIGTVGSTGDSSGNHLHLETGKSALYSARGGKVLGDQYDPFKYIKTRTR